MTSEVVDLGSLPFDRQIALMRRTNILIEAHGRFDARVVSWRKKLFCWRSTRPIA